MKMLSRQLSAMIRLSLLELYRRKDMIVVGILGMVILIPLAFFQPFGVEGAGRYRNEIAMLLIWIFSLAISLGVSARLFPPEFTSRTIYPLLSKPVARGTIIFGKFIGAWIASGSALAVFYLVYAFLSGYQSHVWFPAVLGQAFILHLAFIALVTALGMAGSLLITPSANLTLNGITIVAMFFFGQKLPSYAVGRAFPGNLIITLINWFCPHAEFFDLRQRIVHEWPAVGWGVCGAVVLYAIAYSAAALIVASFAFRKKRL